MGGFPSCIAKPSLIIYLHYLLHPDPTGCGDPHWHDLQPIAHVWCHPHRRDRPGQSPLVELAKLDNSCKKQIQLNIIAYRM